MDVKRAQEICNSPVMANVTYNGKQVYIEHVDQENETATVHPLNDQNDKQNVAVANLIEQ